MHVLHKFVFYVVEEPVTGKKRKGKDSRPLRIDLILQHDSLVPPPKESVFVATYLDVYIFSVFREIYRFFSVQWQFFLIKKCKFLYVLNLILVDYVMFKNDDSLIE